MDVPLEDVHRGIEYMILVFSFRPHDFVLFCFFQFHLQDVVPYSIQPR